MGEPNTPRDGDQRNTGREGQANAKQHVVNVGIRLGHTESLRVRPMIESMSLLLSTRSFSRPEHESAFARLGPGCDPLDAAMHVADAVEATRRWILWGTAAFRMPAGAFRWMPW